MSPLKFYIIITPNSLRFLKFALWSLHKREDLKIVLVANGLNRDEYQELLFFSEQIECDSLNLNTDTVMSHGAALDTLISNHENEWFCFCDSDIVSIRSDANDVRIAAHIKAFSSCEAMFWDEEPVTGVLGRCNRWPDGSKNLTSFFCIYHTETIKFLMDKYKIGFNNILFKDIKSLPLKELMLTKGINNSSRKLDTGKALTAALELENKEFIHSNIKSLLHVGGMSSWMLNGDKKLVNEEYHLIDSELYNIAPEGSWLFNLNSQKDLNNRAFYLRRQQRLAAARYCFQLVSYYVDSTPKPHYDLTDKVLVEKLEKIHLSIFEYFKEFS